MLDISAINWSTLSDRLRGTIELRQVYRTLYATDASIYQEEPAAVCVPHDDEDISEILRFATEHEMPLIPRGAGTSLAGQCVGQGIVVDLSKHFRHIGELDAQSQEIWVQPGVVRDELNRWLEPKGYFFSPITSTANRANIGGMVGNNSSGTTSIEYGTTRDHVREIKGILSDGSLVHFHPLGVDGFLEKCQQNNLEGKIYRQLNTVLSDPKSREEIGQSFPKQNIHRRNTGYALDALLDFRLFGGSKDEFNMCPLICGSEGTLMMMTEVLLHVDRLPPKDHLILVPHFASIKESMRATQIVMEHNPSACELMDRKILDCTKENVEQAKNRFFIEGDPAAVLMVELRAENLDDCHQKVDRLISSLKEEDLGYHYAIVEANRSKSVWDLRKAGLGVLSNIKGDKKAVTCIEDTAVALEDLPEYIEEFTALMASFGQECIYYAHAGAGEIHLRPILDLKSKVGRSQLREISEASVKLVKKYNGSLSGEHGDGRLRGEFIPQIVGEKNYQLFQEIKFTWDPHNIFNPGKIVNAPAMDAALRVDQLTEHDEIDSMMDFSDTDSMLGLAEKCNGSGDCRKMPAAGGTMCPSYHASLDEMHTTRARANILRQTLGSQKSKNRWQQSDVMEVLDLCLSCKACSSECPSNVDMSLLKAEYSFQYQERNGYSRRTRFFANFAKNNRLAARFPKLSNRLLSSAFFSTRIKNYFGIASDRSLPKISETDIYKWFDHNYKSLVPLREQATTVYFFCDEFTRYQDADIGVMAISLLRKLGYEVRLVNHAESGRAAISKGVLKQAKKWANANVSLFGNLLSSDSVLIGIEPSAILSFRDEYPRLVDQEIQDAARQLSNQCFLIEEFISREIVNGNISADHFDNSKRRILLHGHCHQKALSNLEDAVWMLSIATGHEVEIIPSGCCGMAGSFGYEDEHYEMSQRIGELALFPAVREAAPEVYIVASGTSCRHQIADGTGRKAVHPVELMLTALKD